MKKSLLFAFVITIVGSCIISCGSKEEERPWRYDIDYTESLDKTIGGENVPFKGQPERYHCLNIKCGCMKFVSDGAGGCSSCNYYGCENNRYAHSLTKL